MRRVCYYMRTSVWYFKLCASGELGTSARGVDGGIVPGCMRRAVNLCWVAHGVSSEDDIAMYTTGRRVCILRQERYILGIDPGLANTGWGVISWSGARLSCVAYGCVSTDAGAPLAQRLLKINQQIEAVIARFSPVAVGIETVWFGQNITAAFATGQARGAALVACAQGGLGVGEYTPKQIKMAVVGEGSAEKEQVQYMVRQILGLEQAPKPDHASDALAAAICYTTHHGSLSG